MKKYFFAIILLLSSLSTFSQNIIVKTVPEIWIERVINGEDKNKLIQEFGEQFPSKAISTDISEYKKGNSYLNLTKINLDDDIDSEYLLFIGTNYANTMFYTIDDNLKILFEEFLWLHNDYPQLRIFNTEDQHKMFSYTYLYGRGSGRWLFTYKVYKIIEGKVVLVLEFVKDSNDTFNHKGINGRIYTNYISFYGNKLFVNYNYDLYPNQNILSKLEIENEKYSLISNRKESVIYSFDKIKKRLIHNDMTISPKMEKYFFEPSNDSLFLKAFSKELDKIMIEGNENDKKVIEYLRRIEK